jgi:hypothetical protein
MSERDSICASEEKLPHPLFKGDAALKTSKRMRAVRLYPVIGNCENCKTAKAVDRHHKDGNTGNNVRSNVAFLCRRCHMLEDGRLQALLSHKNPTIPPTHCCNCKTLAKPLRRGRCHRCNEFFRRKGIEWSVEAAARKRTDADCDRCGLPLKNTKNYAKGLCHACYEYRRRTGRQRPITRC